MKAERRHELQENSLAKVLENLPVYLQLYAGRILFVVIVVLAGIFLLQYRARTQRQLAESSFDSLASARERAIQLQEVLPQGNPAGAAEFRAQFYSEGLAAAEAAMSAAEGEVVKSEALIARADLYWAAANLPALPGAATQPALNLPESNDSLLDKAAADYNAVLTTYPRQTAARASALFGLAAIAENRGKLDEAKQFYEQIKASDLPDSCKVLADRQLAQLPFLAKPLRLAIKEPPPAPNAPAPTTSPAAIPTTQPAPGN